MKDKINFRHLVFILNLLCVLAFLTDSRGSGDPNYYNFKAIRYYQKGETGLAISVLDSGLHQIGDHAALLNNRAFFKWKQGDYFDAISDLKLALSQGTYNQLKKLLYLNLGRSYIGLQQYENAIFYLSLALDIDAGFRSALELRARAKMQSAELDLNAIQ